MVSQTICLGWLQPMILLISAFWVARITGVSHRCLACFVYLQDFFPTPGTQRYPMFSSSVLQFAMYTHTHLCVHIGVYVYTVWDTDVLFSIWRTNFPITVQSTMQCWMISNSPSSCLSLPSAGIIGVHQHTWLFYSSFCQPWLSSLWIFALLYIF
jgi:hypothetical protein